MSKRKRKVIMIAAMLGVYVISYALLSFCGGYRLVMFGRPNPPDLGISDFVWQPRFGDCYQWGAGYHMDGLGLFYFPLIYCDQKLFIRVAHTSRLLTPTSISRKLMVGRPSSKCTRQRGD
jgi:hypothetical protein